MKNYIRIQFSDAAYLVPVLLIATHRARYLLENVASEYPTIDDAAAGTAKLFEDGQEIVNWATNNMTWADLAPQAMMIESTAPDRSLQRSIGIKEWEFLDEPILPGAVESAHGTADDIPLGLIMANLIAQGGTCNVMTMGDTIALAVIQGEPDVVQAYIGIIQQLTHQIRSCPDGTLPRREAPRILLPH